jgi:regulatory LuxR family protein
MTTESTSLCPMSVRPKKLVITERTVAAHIEHILNKLGFASRHQVGAWAATQAPPS